MQPRHGPVITHDHPSVSMCLRYLQPFKFKIFLASSGVAVSLPISKDILFIFATNWALLSASLPLDM
jgi:hypothetical protein